MGKQTESAEVDRRRQVICAQLAGQCTARAAAAELECSESQYYKLRAKVVAALNTALTPKSAGRPATPPPHPAQATVAELEAQLAQAKLERECADVRLAIAMAMPEAAVGATPKAPTPKRANRRKKGASRGHR